MLRCAASFVTAAYAKIRITPQDLRVLPAALFTKPSILAGFLNFCEFVNAWTKAGIRRPAGPDETILLIYAKQMAYIHPRKGRRT
jgi:hypothetical protein